MTETKQDQVIKEILDTIKKFNAIANSLRLTLILVGIIGVGAALFVTAFTGSEFIKSNDLIVIRIASFISALCLTSLTAFNVVAKGNNARNAYRYLNHGYMMFQIGKFTLEDLVNSKDNAEKILGSVDFQTTITQKPIATTE